MSSGVLRQFHCLVVVGFVLRALAGESEVTSYSDSNALKQLVAIDCAYLGVIGLVNFAFPFCLVPWACNVAQILVLPSQAPASARRTNPTTTKQ